jgi:pimeloyl-ACP methyl ester carboxylesterase
MIKVTSADGTTIASDQIGSGPALVLVAGALTPRSAFEPFGPALGSTFTVYGYDRRGRGDSGDTQPYAPEREIEDLAAVIEAAGGSAYVFGHSSGAALALDAADHGLPITKLAAYEPPFQIDDSRTSLPPDFVHHLTALVSTGQRGEAVAYWMRNTVQLPESEIDRMRTEPWFAGLEAIIHTAVYDATITESRMVGQPLPAGMFANVTMPTLVIEGADSPPFMHHTADALVERLPDARKHTFTGFGHNAPPEVLAPVLIDFFLGTA